MPKKPILILKFSNNSAKCKHEAKSYTKKPKNSASNGSPTSTKGKTGPRKLRP